MDTAGCCRRDFRAMSCTASIVVHTDDAAGSDSGSDHVDALVDRAVDRIGELERRWSRFLPDSEITGLNAAGGGPRRCSADTVELIEAMVAGWSATHGRFDPSLLGPLVELGYANSRTPESSATVLLPGTGFGHRVDLIRVDRGTGVAQLPTGLTLDPGGIGKGLAADIVTRELVGDVGDRSERIGALVEIGGDIRVAGVGPDDGAWTIAVAHPFGGDPEPVRLVNGGVATSTTRLRTWHRAGIDHHHLLDPASGTSTTTDVVACTVIAGTAAWAEVFTKGAFVVGVDDALARFDTLGLAARIVTGDGIARRSTTWKEFAA